MYDYTKTEKADAYQIVFSDKDKADAKKGIPTSSGGQTIRYDSFEDTYSVMVLKLGKQVPEGSWVVTDATGKITVETDKEFAAKYKGSTPAPAEPTQLASTSGADRAAARQKMATV